MKFKIIDSIIPKIGNVVGLVRCKSTLWQYTRVPRKKKALEHLFRQLVDSDYFI
jgi:hypothetical protein